MKMLSVEERRQITKLPSNSLYRDISEWFLTNGYDCVVWVYPDYFKVERIETYMCGIGRRMEEAEYKRWKRRATKNKCKIVELEP
jgi:hypothetical protein